MGEPSNAELADAAEKIASAIEFSRRTPVLWRAEDIRDLRLAAARLRAATEFKGYVHGRLDQAGVPTHTDGPHSALGCRVGDRLDLALAHFPVKKGVEDGA